ncbi:gliding motility protein GldL [Flavobacteriaceae bacterium]|nr:gliding motility protein GldL [Flavobacteriaceae bacterium]
MSTTANKRKFINMVYGLGAAIVILGALFKIQHINIGFITGGLVLSIGLVTEAIIFVISAFDTPEDDLDWTKVYPQLAGGTVGKKTDSPDGLLSKKLDEMLKEAHLDSKLLEDLTKSIQNFEGAAKVMGPASETIASSNKYNEEMIRAAEQMQKLNELYASQMQSASMQANANAEMAENSQKLKEQMESLASNLSSLNDVYGGMLSAMNKN